jgi:hypothetical protein
VVDEKDTADEESETTGLTGSLLTGKQETAHQTRQRRRRRWRRGTALSNGDLDLKEEGGTT